MIDLRRVKEIKAIFHNDKIIIIKPEELSFEEKQKLGELIDKIEQKDKGG